MANTNTATNSSGIRTYSSWCQATGISPVTGWRMRTKGWIETVNIAGRVYISDDAIARFTVRAASGEFAKRHPVPRRNGGAA